MQETTTKAITLDEGKEQFIYACNVEGKADKTIEQYEYAINNFQEYLGDNPALQDIDANDVRRFIISLSKRDYSKQEREERRDSG